MSFAIRELRKEDRPNWEPLWAGYLEFYKSELAPEITDATFARFLDPSEPMQALVAEDDATGALLGVVHCVFHRGTWSIGDFCYLEDLFTAETARGRGVGRALIEAVYKLADERGAGRVYWLTHETNTTARKLYDQVAENRGFIQYRRP
ncbi:MAG: GNAT family N-acetyltransferase [Hyphomonadaceae bacterium JAD_PAG50586_4]|nr:MAG: GNAT family N-acetyltransferase [Hyphomonadaceae bacterium JAD_PAG50586_4]